MFGSDVQWTSELEPNVPNPFLGGTNVTGKTVVMFTQISDQVIYITILTFTSVRPHGVGVPLQSFSCSEFKKPSLTAAEQDEAELHVLNFDITW